MDYLLIGIGLVLVFTIWKLIIEPIMNEGKPIEPPKDYKTFGEKMDEQLKANTNTDVDF